MKKRGGGSSSQKRGIREKRGEAGDFFKVLLLDFFVLTKPTKRREERPRGGQVAGGKGKRGAFFEVSITPLVVKRKKVRGK